MAIVITYDIPTKHVEFKNAMFKLGYQDRIPGIKNCKIIYFPNTTLYHSLKNSATALSNAQTVCQSLGVELERCIATQFGPDWMVLCGEPFKQ